MADHEHNFGPGEWPFQDPVNAVCFTTKRVAREGYPVLLVTHDVDGDWQVLCGTTNEEDQAMLVCLGCAFERNPSIREVADLPLGWTAWRDAPGKPWEREPKEYDDEG